MSRNKSIVYLVTASLFAALIAVFTAWFFHIPIKIGANTAYIHFGDAFVFLAASILPAPYACASAAIGGGLADVFCGAAVWAPFTVVIKALLPLWFSAKSNGLLSKRNIFAFFPVLGITVGGYYVAEALIYGSWVTPVLSVFGNVVQILGSMVVYILIASALQKINVKKMMNI